MPIFSFNSAKHVIFSVGKKEEIKFALVDDKMQVYGSAETDMSLFRDKMMVGNDFLIFSNGGMMPLKLTV